MIRCTKCKVEKDSTSFRNDIKKRNGKRSICRQCDLKADKRTPEQERKRVREYRKKNPDKLYISNRRTKLKRAYGLTLEDYELILKEQKGVCLICKSPPSKKMLAVDHCHNTGKVRGLLCSKCNTALGLVTDSKDILNKMIIYLERHLEE